MGAAREMNKVNKVATSLILDTLTFERLGEMWYK